MKKGGGSTTRKSFGFVLCAFFMAVTVLPLHAVGVNDLKFNLKSGKITETVHNTNDSAKIARDTSETKIISRPVKYTSPKKNSKTPFVKQYPQPYQYKPMKIKVGNAYKTVNVLCLTYVPPASPTKKSEPAVKTAIKPQRIGAPIRVQEQEPFVFTPLIEVPNPTNDTKKAAGIEKLTKLYGLINSAPNTPGESQLSSIIREITMNYGDYKDLCALARLYHAEFQFKKYYDTSWLGNWEDWAENEQRVAYQESYYVVKNLFDEIKDAYGHGQNEICDSVISVIGDDSNGIYMKLKGKITENETKMDEYVDKLFDNIEKSKTSLKNMQGKIYANASLVPTVDDIKGIYKQIEGNYIEISWNLRALRDVRRAKEIFGDFSDITDPTDDQARKSFDKLYGSIPDHMTFEYYINPADHSQGTAKKEVGGIKKDFMYYSFLNKTYLETISQACEMDKADEKLIEMATYLIENHVNATYNNNYEQNLAGEENKTSDNVNNITSTIVQCRKKAKLDNPYFTNEEDKRQSNNYIFGTSEILTLRARINFTGEGQYSPYYYPIRQVAINSGTSNRSKSLTLKRNYYDNMYTARFRINEDLNSVDPNTNLINCDRDALKESIACLNSLNFLASMFDFYTTSETLLGNSRKKSGYAIRQKYVNASKNIFGTSKEFLKAGGAEVIKATIDSTEAVTLAQNQADWLIIDSHGWVTDEKHRGGIAFINPYGKLLTLVPEELIDSKEVSAYSEDLDILVLNACGCLKWIDKNTELTYAHGWHKALPEGIILGYGDTVAIDLSAYALSEFCSYKEIKTNDDIIRAWIEVNYKAFEKYSNGIFERNENSEKHCEKTVYIVGQNHWQISNHKKIKRDNTTVGKVKIDVINCTPVSRQFFNEV